MGPIATQALGIGSGIISGAINDFRQLFQQGKLNAQQWEMMKKQMDYQQRLQLEMWEKTGYGPQMKQLQAAGLNPALIYGMSGGGAQTTGNTTAQNNAPHAPAGGNEFGIMSGLALQAKQTEANVKVAESQANLNNTQAESLRGAPGTKGEQEIEQLKTAIDKMAQETTNERELYQIRRLEVGIKNLEKWKLEKTLNDQIDSIHYEALTLLRRLQTIQNEGKISDDTVDEAIKLIEQEVINQQLQAASLKAGTAKTKEETRFISTDFSQRASAIQARWEELNMKIDMKNEENQKKFMEEFKDIPGDVMTAIIAILLLRRGTGGHTEVEGFRRRNAPR